MKKNERGFTLVEVIVVMVILTAGIIGVFTAIRSGLTASKMSDRLTDAALLAQRLISEAENLDPLEPGSESGDFGDDYPLFSWERDVAVSDYSDNLFVVTVRVKWTDSGQEQSREIETLMWRDANEQTE